MSLFVVALFDELVREIRIITIRREHACGGTEGRELSEYLRTSSADVEYVKLPRNFDFTWSQVRSIIAYLSRIH